ncbi:MAG: PDDEXK nuclease domain-containing protein [Terrimicrobiaceae bacterium]|nr:PDDEXK nuclease domain-containing protein [Terrimicrobiaceae bacterium]
MSKPASQIKTSLLPSTYAPLLADLKARVRASQVKAAVAVNRELILLYWHIGREILRAQKAEGWGAKVIEQLATDLSAEFPEIDGFSVRNLKYMRAFADAWEAIEIVQQPVAQLAGTSFQQAAGQIAPQPVAQLRKAKVQQSVAQLVSQPVTQFEGAPPEPLSLLPWSANLILLHKLKDPATRLWYARKAVEHGWSRAVLTVQIESRLHERSGKAITNFGRTLPPAQSDMAREVLKDPYTFDFLTLGEAAHERDLERGLVEHVQKLLLEMGAGFAFVGRQVHVEVGGEDFYLDLLFYHLRLRCFMVVDLKMKPFEPEFAGKMNFYLSALDDKMRHKDDAPSIGLLLCKDSKNKLKVEYALRDVKKPIGVAEWQTRLVESLPKKLQGSLPAIEDIERELNKPLRERAKRKFLKNNA